MIRAHSLRDKDLLSLTERVEAILDTESKQDYFLSASHSIYLIRPESRRIWDSEEEAHPQWGAHIVIYLRSVIS